MSEGWWYITARTRSRKDVGMPISKKQLIRFVRLVASLKENRYPNCSSFAAELCEADIDENINVACSPKTIARDIQILKNDFGAPIKFNPVRNGYYLTKHNWNFSCPQFFEDTAVFSAVLGVRVSEHIFPEPMKQDMRAAVDYLLTNNNPDALDQTLVESLIVIPSNRIKVNANVFMPLFLAWQNHEICHVDYEDSRAQTTERDFEPHTMVFYDGAWYTKGFCHFRKQMRTLTVARMKSVKPTGKKFTPDPKIIKTANEDEVFDYDMVENVVVHCDDYLTKLLSVRQLHPKQKVELLPNGESNVFVAKLPRHRLITWVMNQCGRATVITPHACADALFEFGEKISYNHANKMKG